MDPKDWTPKSNTMRFMKKCFGIFLLALGLGVPSFIFLLITLYFINKVLP
jgi:hypothetical protein